MASKKVFIEIRVSDKASKPIKETEDSVKRLYDVNELYAKGLKNLTEDERKYLREVERRKIVSKETKIAIEQQTIAQLKANKALNQSRTNAGLNNAIIAESARLASDASYGYTAIANNLGQLISLFAASANAAGGLTKAITALFSIQSLFLIGIQLLITYGEDIVAFFNGNATAIDREREALEKDTKALKENIEQRRLYSQSLLSATRMMAKDMRELFFGNIDDIENQDLRLQELSARLEKQGVKNAKIVADETIALDARLLIAEKLLQIYDEETTQTELRNKQDAANLDLVEARQKKQNVLNQDLDVEKEITEKALSASNKLINQAKNQVKNINEQIILSRGNVRELEKEIAVLEKRGVVLTPPPEKKGRQRRFIRQFLNFTKQIESARLVARTKSIEREEDLIKEQGIGEIKLLQERTNRFIEKQKERLNSKLITEKQYLDSELQAYTEFEEARLAIQSKTDARILDKQIARKRVADELDLKSFRNRESNELEFALISERIEGKRARARIDLQQSVVNQEIRSIEERLAAGNLEVDERAKLENQLTKKQGQQAKIRMAIADAEANAKVQAFQVTADALNAFSKLAGEDTKAGKALAVSGALISTYLSAQKAFESQFKPLATVDSPVRGAIAAAAAVASGLANVKAILSVNPEGQTTAASVQAPAFNVVGTSQVNQLAETVSAQLGNQPPVKAFVVGAEVTDQQAFDRKIIETAGL